MVCLVMVTFVQIHCGVGEKGGTRTDNTGLFQYTKWPVAFFQV